MSGTDRPVSEEDLHAYVDNLLAPEREPIVLRYLRENLAEAERIAAYRAQREMLRAALAPHAGGALPPHLNPHVLIARHQGERRMRWRAAAMVVLAFGLGGGGGWFLRESVTPPPTAISGLVRDAVANHVVYTADRRRPTELGADQRDDLARWVSNRINYKVAPPDLTDSGYRYIGGRLAATPEGPAGMFMYQNEAGVRLTVFVRPGSSAPNAPIVPVDGKPMGGCAWIEKGVGFTVVAPIPAEELHRVATEVQRLLDSRV
jgi:anti-sigma factor RsiW